MLLKIKNLKLKTFLGIHPWEEKINREIIINIEIEPKSELALTSDNIDDTIDYDALVTKITNIVNGNKFKLVEAMAKRIISEVMKDKMIKRCKLEIDKVGAIESIDSFSVTIQDNQ